jgi:hypothetical protein
LSGIFLFVFKGESGITVVIAVNADYTYGDYRITVITPVCGTGYPGSIPGSRPNVGTPSGVFCIWAAKKANFFAFVRNRTPERCEEV